MIKISSAIFKTFFLSLCIVANTHFAFAQTASILPPGYTQYLDSNGKPLSAGKVYNYIPSTTTPKTTWQDAAETIPNANPVILDAGGRAKILGDGSYRQIVKDRNNVTIWDAVTSSTGSGSTSPTATGDGDLVGTIKPWAGMIAPNQYAFAYGQEISRTTYSALYTAITSTQSVFCNSGSPILNGLSNTTNFWIGMTVEVTCVAAGFSTIVSKTSSTVTLAANANATTNINAIFYPWGRGNGTTTFNLPDLRGVVLAGNNNMGGVASANLNTAYFGTTDPNSVGALGGNQSNTLTSANSPSHIHSIFLNDPGHFHPMGVASSGAVGVAQITVGGGAQAIDNKTGTATTSVTVRDAPSGAGTANQTTPFGGGIATAATVAAVGSGYTPGAQTITVSGGTCTTQPQFTVTISGGGNFSGTPVLLTAGSCTVAPTNPAATSGGGGSSGTLNVSYSAQPISIVQPTRTTNYIIKITPDANSATASGVTSLGGMTGSIACGSGLLCTGNIVSTTTGISGPGTTTVGHVALWDNIIGTALSDSDILSTLAGVTTLKGTTIAFNEGANIIGGFGVGGFAASTFVVMPNGTDVRVACSNTSCQLHYDNIVLGTASGGAIVEAPRITWKVPDYNSNNGGLDHPLGNIGANATAFIISAGANGPSDGTTSLPLEFATQDTVGAETIQMYIAGASDTPLIGVGTTNPLNDIAASSIQIHGGIYSAHVHFTNTDSGATGSDGAYVGLNASEQLRVWNYENQSIIFGVNNTNVGTLKATGILDLPVGIQIASAATSGNYLRGNGTNFVSSAIQSSDLRSSGGSIAIGQSHIPFVFPSSGTMGNNGALSGITALPTTYSHAYVYMPANAIEAGSSAGWYYAIFSSTTAATLYNNTYTSGTPSIPGSPTAFVTTGPGAYTQTTGSYITAYTMTVTGGIMGTNGTVRASGMASYLSSAGGKAVRATFGGSTIAAASGTTTTNLGFVAGVSNRGVSTAQVPLTSAGLQYTGVSTAPSYLSAATASDQSMAFQLQLVAAATDFIVLETVIVELIPGV